MKNYCLLIVYLSIANAGFLFSQTTSPSPYCVADFDDHQGSPVTNSIKSVTIGTFVNNTNAQYVYPHYVFYNNLPAHAFKKEEGLGYVHVVFNVVGNAGYGIWIDFNHNNSFEASEKVMGTLPAIPLYISPSTGMGSTFSIPSYALTGITRLRVRIVGDNSFTMGPNGYSILPCNTGTSSVEVMDYGETEDYNVNITIPAGIEEPCNLQELHVYPNPSSSVLTVDRSNAGVLNYEFYSLTGTLISRGILNDADKQISVYSLPNGFYFLKFFKNNKLLGQQLFIKN